MYTPASPESLSLECEILVIGGGPAGSSAAYWLAQAGREVVLVDRARFPRYKTCAGGLEPKTTDLFDFSLDPVIERATTRLWATTKLRRPVDREAGRPLVYCVMRDRLDAFLLEKARAAGVTVLEGERVLAVEEQPGSVRVRTPRRTIRAGAVLGADGALSTVRRALYPGFPLQRVIAAQAEVAVSPADLERMADAILLDVGTLPGGYAWAFPKSDHLSVGAGGPLELSGRVKGYLHGFLEMLVREGLLEGYAIERLSSHLLPMATGAGVLHTRRTVLLGDAAGLIDPFTGEGIYYAVRSARIAADVVDRALSAAALQGGERLPDLAPYTAEIASTLMPEITSARLLMFFHGLSPWAFHTWLRRSDRLWRAVTRSFSGDKSYVSYREELGRAQFLWPAIDALGAAVWRRRVKKMTSADRSRHRTVAGRTVPR